jgi:hypothetical protein
MNDQIVYLSNDREHVAACQSLLLHGGYMYRLALYKFVARCQFDNVD